MALSLASPPPPLPQAPVEPGSRTPFAPPCPMSLARSSDPLSGSEEGIFPFFLPEKRGDPPARLETRRRCPRQSPPQASGRQGLFGPQKRKGNRSAVPRIP